ncbi:MAG: hypothetical protein ACYCW6_23400 [Candidatus Xenobia bacterium]
MHGLYYDAQAALRHLHVAQNGLQTTQGKFNQAAQQLGLDGSGLSSDPYRLRDVRSDVQRVASGMAPADLAYQAAELGEAQQTLAKLQRELQQAGVRWQAAAGMAARAVAQTSDGSRLAVSLQEDSTQGSQGTGKADEELEAGDGDLWQLQSPGGDHNQLQADLEGHVAAARSALQSAAHCYQSGAQAAEQAELRCTQAGRTVEQLMGMLKPS